MRRVSIVHDRHIDPVCGRTLESDSDGLSTEYADVTYAYCSQECMTRFTEQPDIFTAQPGRGQVADNDRALRDDADKGQLIPGQPARLTNSPPTPGAG